MSGEQTDRETDEVEAVVCRRRREALDAGLSWQDAENYAESQVGTEELRRLVALDCPRKLLAKILL